MRTFRLSKLIRDKVFDNMIELGQKLDYKTLGQAELIEALKQKLTEESQEFDPKDKEPLKELADLQEIIDTLVTEMGFEKDDLLQTQKIIREKRGGFGKQIFVESVTLDDGDNWVEYYANNSDRFPEIK